MINSVVLSIFERCMHVRNMKLEMSKSEVLIKVRENEFSVLFFSRERLEILVSDFIIPL